VYATILHWPKNSLLTLHRPEVGSNNQVLILGYDGPSVKVSIQSHISPIRTHSLSISKRGAAFLA
jgi:Alpha-L-fucosidase C-terminal domain